jgi:hypothetical protein
VAVTHPSRAPSVDVARTAGFEEAVAVLDAALHRRLVTSAALAGARGPRSGLARRSRARRAIEFADPRARSVGESRSRVAMSRHGVARPVLAMGGGRPGGVVLGTAGFGWPEHGVGGEFDGLVKYGRVLRRGQARGEAEVRRRSGAEERMRSARARFRPLGVGGARAFADVAQRLPR